MVGLQREPRVLCVEGVMKNIAEFIRARRKASGFTQQELAELAGVGVRFVGDLERAKPTLRVAGINAVLGVFGKELGVIDRPRRRSSGSDQRP